MAGYPRFKHVMLPFSHLHNSVALQNPRQARLQTSDTDRIRILSISSLFLSLPGACSTTFLLSENNRSSFWLILISNYHNYLKFLSDIMIILSS